MKSIAKSIIALWMISSSPVCLGADETAKKLTREQWEEYFKVAHNQKDQIWRATMTAALMGGVHKFEIISKYKGTKDGATQIASVMKGGPYDGDQEKKALKVTEKGLFSIKQGEEILKIPFPLTTGQEWEANEVKYTFKGIEDYETPTQTIKDCIVLVSFKKKQTTERWYSKEHGPFFAKMTPKGGSLTQVLNTVK